MANVRYHKVGKWPACLLFSCFTLSLEKNNTPLQATELKKKEEWKRTVVNTTKFQLKHIELKTWAVNKKASLLKDKFEWSPSE